MKRYVLYSLLSITLLCAMAQPKPVKNVILMIPDGTSTSLLSAARWYQTYQDPTQTTLNIDPYICGLVRTHSSDAPIGDSAPTTSCYVSGQPSQTGFISTYPVATDHDLVPVDAISAAIPAEDLLQLQSDPFLMSLFGGIVFGFGIALCLRCNATSGGTDFIAIYLSEKKGQETWNLILAFNALVLLAGGFKSGWTSALYSIIYQFVYIQVVHLMYRTYQYQTLIIVTTQPKKVCEAIYRISHHGATVINAKGAFKGEDKSVVMSVVAADDTTRIYAICKSLDSEAFINTISTSRVIGRFYLRPRD